MNSLRVSFLLSLMLAASAEARPPPPVVLPDYTCPIGDEPFVQYEGMQNRLGSGEGWPIFDLISSDPGFRYDIANSEGYYEGFPECPSNGLPMYRTFTADELKRLPTLLKDPAFLALRKGTPQPMRIHWLATQFGDSPEQRLVLAIPAVYLARTSRIRKRARQLVANAFAEVPFGFSFKEHSQLDSGKPIPLADKIDFRMIYVHTLRTLGEFDKALAELNALPVSELNGTVPDPIEGPVEGEGENAWRPVLNQDEIDERKKDRYQLAQIALTEQIILRRDPTPTLFELMAEGHALSQCEEFKRSKLSPSNRAFCNRPSIVTRRKMWVAEIESAVDAAAHAAACSAPDSQRAEIEKKPKPWSPEDETIHAALAAQEASCDIMRASGP